MRAPRFSRPFAHAAFALVALTACGEPHDSAPAPGSSASPLAALSSSAAPRPTAASTAVVDAPARKCSSDNWCEMMAMRAGSLHAVWGTNTGNIYALWSGALVHFDGDAWAPVAGASTDKDRLWGLSGSDAGNVWAVGDAGAALHFNGKWAAVKIPTKETLRAAFTRAEDDAWAVGTKGTIAHWDGKKWWVSSPAVAKGRELLGVWASSAKDVWAVGDGGVVLHWDGAAWAVSAAETEFALGAVSGTGPKDVWAVGSAGTIVHFDGTRWKHSFGGVKQALFAVWTEDAKNAWAVGDAGTIVHWDGAVWSRSPSGTSDELHGIWGPIGRDLWVVGFSVSTGRTSTWRRHE
jgi:hypothetical protein